MRTPREIAEDWQIIKSVYKETRDETPKETIDMLLTMIPLEDAKETFAVITKIKKHDGRIYGKNREIMEAYPTSLECCEWSNSNPVCKAGLDDIHTTHINQLITELLKR